MKSLFRHFALISFVIMLALVIAPDSDSSARGEQKNKKIKTAKKADTDNTKETEKQKENTAKKSENEDSAWLLKFREDLKNEQELLEMSEKILPRVIELRGLKPTKKIWTKIIFRDDVIKYVAGMFSEETDPEDTANQDILLKKLGLIKDNTDTVAIMKNLLNKQIGGFYDMKTRTLFLIHGVKGQEVVAAHELTHALQDQNFDMLGKFQLNDRDNEDASAARRALIEGDATLLMTEYALKHIGLMKFQKMMKDQNTAESAEDLKKAPRFLVQAMIFPYMGGANFCQAIKLSKNNGWQSITDAYKNPPSSTEQILHPNKFIEKRDNPTPIELPDLTPILGKEYKMTVNNVMGEFGIRQILLEYLDIMNDDDDKHLSAAPEGWDGDRYALYINDKKHSVLAWKTVWDSENDAKEFFDAMNYYYKKRFPDAKPAKATKELPGKFLKNGNEYIYLHLDKQNVWVIDGIQNVQDIEAIKSKTKLFDKTEELVE